MCPDRELLSAYVDGEVPNPWSTRIAEHLASCPACSAAVARYSSLGGLLRSDFSQAEAGAVERVRLRLEEKLAGGTASLRPEPASGHRERAILWRRYVSLPLPLAAAAALALALLAGAAALVAFKPAREPIQSLAAEISPLPAKPASMDALLQYLDSKDAQVTLTIRLPSGTTLDSSGSPVIMRAPEGGTGQAPRLTPVAAPPAEGQSPQEKGVTP